MPADFRMSVKRTVMGASFCFWACAVGDFRARVAQSTPLSARSATQALPQTEGLIVLEIFRIPCWFGSPAQTGKIHFTADPRASQPEVWGIISLTLQTSLLLASKRHGYSGCCGRVWAHERRMCIHETHKCIPDIVRVSTRQAEIHTFVGKGIVHTLDISNAYRCGRRIPVSANTVQI